MLRVRMLGGFGAECAGRQVRFSTRKVAALLALLALRPGAAVPRARLAAMLWPESGGGRRAHQPAPGPRRAAARPGRCRGPDRCAPRATRSCWRRSSSTATLRGWRRRSPRRARRGRRRALRRRPAGRARRRRRTLRGVAPRRGRPAARPRHRRARRRAWPAPTARRPSRWPRRCWRWTQRRRRRTRR